MRIFLVFKRLLIYHSLCPKNGFKIDSRELPHKCHNRSFLNSTSFWELCQKKKKFYLNTTQNHKNMNISRSMPILAIRSSTRSLQSTGKQGFDHGTLRHTHSQLMNIATLDTELAQWAVSAKNLGNKRLVCVPHRNVCNYPTRAKNQKINFY